ncbi:hypothetical protein P4O66_002140 [Electrophorus voltai]|uniref:Gypsy retrotransposon integrase-like protein 1 n=1 Tax=Electrophorus voltai TaxID=2609070 RepID=A0AAD8Z250_9TELE|nr:hypothetical protein P4O66_002140 [Electrophorus voltai]
MLSPTSGNPGRLLLCPQPLSPGPASYSQSSGGLRRQYVRPSLLNQTRVEALRGGLYVPKVVRAQVLEWGHASPFSVHPGVTRMLEYLRRRFWWPCMEPDVRAFVNSCRTCAQCKDPRTRPAGLLHPLAVPLRHWSHLSLDFITGLPPSRGNMVILVVNDRFSKAGCFFALPKLPSAKETAKLLLTQVVRLHGLPSDIVSDHGPQFTSRFWGAFCRLLGAEASLSSSSHPQSNGQTERVNQDLEHTLRCLASSCPSSWSEHLLWVEFAHNTL